MGARGAGLALANRQGKQTQPVKMASPPGQIKVTANLLHLLLERGMGDPRLLLQQLDQRHIPFAQPLGHHLMIRTAKQAIEVVALPGRYHAAATNGKREL